MSSECHMSIKHNSLFRLPYDWSDLVIVNLIVDIDVSLHQCLLVQNLVFFMLRSWATRTEKRNWERPSTETEHQEKIKPFNKSLEQFTEFNLMLIKHNGNVIWYTSLYAHSCQWLAKIISIHQFLKLDDLITLNKRGISNNWRNLSTTITNSIVVLVGCFLAMFACIKIELEIRSKINQWCLTHWHLGGI